MAYNMFNAIRTSRPPEERLSLAQLKQLLREQFLLLTLDEQRAVEAIPKLLPRNGERRRAALEDVQRMILARGMLSDEGQRRLQKVESLFEVMPEKPLSGHPAHA